MVEIKISVIVPVYNVEEYIGQCLESILNQTYQNIEIIVINDGSTDNSGDICAKLAKKYGFIYVSKRNEGLGPTRNMGVRIARGDYVLFVDSDDWLAQNAVEKIVSYIGNGYADFIALSSYFEYNHKTGEIKEVRQNNMINKKSIQSEMQKRLYLLYGFVIMWGKLFKKDFLLKNEIVMPAIPHEDNAIFPITIFMANDIVFYNEPLYYYRVHRAGNIQSKISHFEYLSDACENFLKYFIKHEILGKHYAPVKYYVETRLKWAFDSYSKGETDVEKEMALYNKFAKFHKKYFGKQKAYWEYKFALLGSFGSRWVVHHLAADIGQLAYHMPFSSLISQMTHGSADKYEIHNKNKFRCEKIVDDIEGKFVSMLKDSAEKVDFIFIDFMEERYNIAELEDGNYITLSEAFKDSFIEGQNIKRVIQAGTSEHYTIWQKSCMKFVKILRKKYRDKQIILIKSRLATQYQKGNGFEDYPEKQNLEMYNSMFEQMENYFLELMRNRVQTYSYPEKLYTEENFRMGREAQYSGNFFYWGMKMQISACFDCIAE